MQRNQGLVPAGGTVQQQQQTLMSQQRTVEQRSSSSATMIRESHTRASETHVSQQSFSSHQQSTLTSQRVQGMLVQPQQQMQQMVMGQRMEGSPPVFEQIFRNARFAQGGNALFEGKVNGTPTPEVSWTRQGQPISDSNKYQMKYESHTGKVSLLISLIGPGDEGEYTCSAINPFGEAICTVYIQPEALYVQSRQEEMTQIQAAQAQLQATQAIPVEERFQRQLSQTVESGIKTSGSYVRTHYEKTLERNTAGRVEQQSTVSNESYYANGNVVEEDFKVDTFEYRILREVEFRDQVTRLRVGEAPEPEEVEQVQGPIAPPTIGVKPRNSKLLEGSDAGFTVKISGNPKPQVTWFKNGIRLLPSPRHVMTNANQMATLKIRLVVREDSGHYTMLAENPSGCVVSSAFLAVEAVGNQDEMQFKTGAKPVENGTANGYSPSRPAQQQPEPGYENSAELSKSLGPQFVKVPSDITVSEGKLVRLDCRATGRPYPDVMWYLNGQKIFDDLTHKILVNEAGNHSLMITSASPYDTGVITCVAKNKGGETSFQVNLSVIEKEQLVAPKFVERFSTMNVKEGEPVVLNARAVGTPAPKLTWQKDNALIYPSQDALIQSDNGYSSLEIPAAKLSDSAWYQCTATNVAGSTATRARLFVQAEKAQNQTPRKLTLPKPTKVIELPPEQEPEVVYLRHVERSRPHQPKSEEERATEPPVFIAPLKDVSTFEGDRALFEAKITPVGDSTLRVEWYVDGKPLPASSRVNTINRFGYISLTIISLVREDRGIYTCRIINDSGYADCAASLTVSPKPLIESSAQHPESLQQITMLEDYSRYQRTESVDDNSNQAPQFIKTLHDLGDVQEGSYAHFEAQILPVSDPFMRIEWFRDGKAITASSRVNTIYNFGYVALNIMYLRAEDTGVYVVRASNRLGEVQSQASVKVVGRSGVTADLGIPEQERYIERINEFEAYQQQQNKKQYVESIETTSVPEFKSPIKDQIDIREGGFAHFEARLEPVGDPTMKIEWLKDGKPVEASSRITSFFNFGYVALTIKSITVLDRGIYSCRAKNSVGTADVSAKLTVISKKDVIMESQHPGGMERIQYLEDSSRLGRTVQEETTVTIAPRFVGGLKGTTKILEGQRAHFEARLEPVSDTTMVVEWYFNGKLIMQASRIKTFYDFGYVALDITDVRMDDAGTYTVMARNSLGEVQLTTQMEVEGRSVVDYSSLNRTGYEKTQRLEQTKHSEPQYTIEEISKSKPVFVQPLNDPAQPIPETKNIHLECRLEPMGDPSMRVEWFFNGKPITIGSRFKTYFDFGYVALDVLSVTSLDAGEYTVRATNHLGSAHTSACVKIMSRSGIIAETQNEAALEQLQYLEDSSRYQRTQQEEVTFNQVPVFSKPLHSLETIEGTNIHLECRLTPVGDPSMRIDWLVNGKPVRTGHRFRPAFDFDYVALDILSVYPEDSGVYTCRSYNRMGEAVTSASVKVIAKSELILESQHPAGLEQIQYLEDSSRYRRKEDVDEIVRIRPKFLTKPKSVDNVKESQNAHFECKLEPVADSNLKVEWLKNGRPITVGHRFRPIHDFGYVALDIIGVIAEDSGVYTCRAVNSVGQDEVQCALQCKSLAQILTESQSQAGLEQFTYLEDKSRYQRSELVEEMCTQAPVFTSSLKNMDISEGQRAHFECRLIPVSDPTLKVEWFLNKVPLKSGSRFIETNNFGFVALDIMYAFAEDSGVYTCRATNALGESVTQCQLAVKGQKTIFADSQHEGALTQIQYLEDGARNQRMSVVEDSTTQAPVFTQPMKDLMLGENQTAHFEARLIPVGDPKLKVQWFRNGVPIQEASRTATMNDFGYVAFDMKYVYPEDSGTYECRAANELGQAVTSATLVVKSKASLITETQHQEALAKIQYLEDSSRYQRATDEETLVTQVPKFVASFNGPTKLVEGQSAHFECRIEPYPDPTLKVEFFFNGQPLAIGHRFRTTYDFGFAALDILTCYPEDTGTYTLRATNRLGMAESSITISVTGRSGLILESQHQQALDKIHYLEDASRFQRRDDTEMVVTEKPSFGRGLKNQEKLIEGQAVHLEATVTPVNDAKMKVEWFHNGRPVSQGHRFRTTYDFGYVALDILYAYPEDSGTYMCRATNSLGEAATTCSIKIEGKSGLLLDTLDESRLEKIRQLEDVHQIAKEDAQLVITRPNFTTALSSLENLREGEHAHLETRLEPLNDPNLKVQWFVNGVEIRTGHRFRTTHDFGYVALDILCAYPEDSGTYMCKATNTLGEAVNTCTISVSARRNVYLDTQHPDGWEKIRALESHSHARPSEATELPVTRPRFITELQGSNQLVEGQTAHMECRVEPVHDPKLRVEFFHDGKLLQSAARFHTTFDFGYVALDIGHVVSEDSGEYTVKATNQLGEAVTSSTIRVEAKSSIISESQRPEGLDKIRELEDASRHQRPDYTESISFQRPVFTAPLSNVDAALEGGSAHFECRLIPVGDPSLKVEWYRNEQPLEYSSRIQRTHDFGYVALDISYLRPEDEGVYMCRATNALGEAVTTASIRIKSKAGIQLDTLHSEGMKRIQELEDRNYKRAPEDEDKSFEKPVFTSPLSGPSDVHEGQHAHFECRVLPVGDPTLRFEWYVNGVELKMGSRFKVTHDFGYVTLDINSCIPEDAGVYMCKAINRAGEAVSTTAMHVRARGSVLGDAQQPNAWERIQLKEAEMNQQRPEYVDAGVQQMPHFVNQLVSHDRLVENSNIHLDCQVEPKNDANLRIEWYKNGIQLNMGSRIRTTFDFGLVGLDIIGLRPDDSGIFMCKAINKIGEAVTTCTIKVEGRDWLIGNAQRPEALSRIADLEAPKGHRREEADVSYDAPVFISHLNNVECNEADTAHFECKVEPSKDPTMKIDWYVNGKLLPTAARFNSTYDFGFVSLDVTSVYPEDNGVYTCKATNCKGSAVSTGTLRCTSKSSIYFDTQHPQGKAGLEEIEKAEAAYYAKYQRQESAGDQQFPKPMFIVALEPQFNLGEGEPLHLESHVEPKQDPNLKIEWFFNGKLLDHASRFKVTNDFGFVTLDLTDVYTRDQGVYTCRASNKAGEAFTSTTVYCSGKDGLIESTQHPKGAEGLGRIQALEDSLLHQEGVTPETEGHAPIFTSQFQNVSNLVEGEIAHFEATLTPIGDQNMKVEWFYNGQVLKASSRVRTVYDFGMVVLEILGTKVEDSGLYTCKATNSYGTAEISVTLECVDLASGQRPQFTTHIKSLEGLKDGDSAHFECTLVPVNDPKLKVEWFHNGQPMKMSSRIKTVSDFGFVVLDIAYVQSHDSGEYVCKASNKYGEDTTRATIKCFGKGGVYLDTLQPDSLARIRELEQQPFAAATPISPTIEAPRFVTQVQPVQLIEGQSAHFEARLTPVNDPKLTVEWYVNGKKLPTGHRFRTFHDFGIVILDILYCYAEDSGEYECRAVNELGQDATKSTLQCMSKAGLILDSQLPGEMQAGLQKIQNLEDFAYLKRESTKEESVRQAPVFTAPLSNVDGLKEGENAHFEGKLTPTDDPRMKVEWFHNGKPLKTGSRIRSFCDFGFVILEISPVYPEDSGVYECRASNEYGSAVTSATLKCSGKRNVILESQLPKGMERTIERIAELEGLGARPDAYPVESESGKAPEFITTPSDQQLPENGCAHFECKVLPVNDPSLRVEWYHNGKPLGSGSRVKTISDFGFVILEISGVYQRDAGMYTCKATNKHGEASVSCTLTVKGRQGIVLEPQLPQKFRSGNESIMKLEETMWKREEAPIDDDKPNPPKFVTELTSIVDHPEGSPVHFECRVEPTNDSTLRVEWYHNGRPLDLGSRIHALDDFGFVVLDMDWTFERDSGEYICRATNKWGTAVTKCTLQLTTKRNVVVDSQLPDGMTGAKLKELERGPMSTPYAEDKPAEPPRFVTHIQSLQVDEGEKAHFECRIEPKNDPRLRIEWYFNGQALQLGHRFRTVYEMGFVSLDILYAYPEDAGEYCCIARNAAGTDKTVAAISCKKAPAIIMHNQMPKGMKKSEALVQMEAALKKYTSEIHLTEDDIYDADKNQPPRFVIHIKDQLTLVEMQATKFECQLAPVGDPNMKVEWFFNGKPLPYKNRFTPIYDFGYVAMNFGWIYPEDSGEYVCRATNLYGSDETRAVINTTGKPGIIYESQLPKGMQSVEKIRVMEAAWQRVPDEEEGEIQRVKPTFVTQPENVEVLEGEMSRFCCRVTGVPRPRVMWLINGHAVMNGTRYKLTYDGMWHLDIPKTRQYDNGKVEVLARNSSGEAYACATLKVTPRMDDYRNVLKNSPKQYRDTKMYRKPDWVTRMEEIQAQMKANQQVPSFTTPLLDVWIRERETAKFECYFTGNPVPELSFYYNGKVLKNSKQIQIRMKNEKAMFTLFECTVEMEGEYVCKAHSEAGDAETKAILHVQAMSDEERQQWEEKRQKEMADILNFERERKEAEEQKKNARKSKKAEYVSAKQAVREAEIMQELQKDIKKAEDELLKIEEVVEVLTGNWIEQKLVKVEPTIEDEEITLKAQRANVAVERIQLSEAGREIEGRIKVANLSFHKDVAVRATCDSWKSYKDHAATYLTTDESGLEVFEFKFEMPRYIPSNKVEMCIRYACDQGEFWDSNDGCNFVVLPPYVFHPSLVPGVKTLVHLAVQESVNISEISPQLIAKEFAAGESPMADIAKLDVMLKKGVTISQVMACFETGEFPTLRTPEAQTGLVKLSEQLSESAVVTEVLCEEVKGLIEKTPVGLKAFLKMVEEEKESINVEEIITELKANDFAEDPMPLEEMAKVSLMLKEGVTSQEVIKFAEAGELPSLVKPESQIPLIRMVGKQGHSAIVAQVIVEESAALLKETQPLAEYQVVTTEPEQITFETAAVAVPNVKEVSEKQLPVIQQATEKTDTVHADSLEDIRKTVTETSVASVRFDSNEPISVHDVQSTIGTQNLDSPVSSHDNATRTVSTFDAAEVTMTQAELREGAFDSPQVVPGTVANQSINALGQITTSEINVLRSVSELKLQETRSSATALHTISPVESLQSSTQLVFQGSGSLAPVKTSIEVASLSVVSPSHKVAQVNIVTTDQKEENILNREARTEKVSPFAVGQQVASATEVVTNVKEGTLKQNPKFEDHAKASSTEVNKSVAIVSQTLSDIKESQAMIKSPAPITARETEVMGQPIAECKQPKVERKERMIKPQEIQKEDNEMTTLFNLNNQSVTAVLKTDENIPVIVEESQHQIETVPLETKTRKTSVPTVSTINQKTIVVQEQQVEAQTVPLAIKTKKTVVPTISTVNQKTIFVKEEQVEGQTDDLPSLPPKRLAVETTEITSRSGPVVTEQQNLFEQPQDAKVPRVTEGKAKECIETGTGKAEVVKRPKPVIKKQPAPVEVPFTKIALKKAEVRKFVPQQATLEKVSLKSFDVADEEVEKVEEKTKDTDISFRGEKIQTGEDVSLEYSGKVQLKKKKKSKQESGEAAYAIKDEGNDNVTLKRSSKKEERAQDTEDAYVFRATRDEEDISDEDVTIREETKVSEDVEEAFQLRLKKKGVHEISDEALESLMFKIPAKPMNPAPKMELHEEEASLSMIKQESLAIVTEAQTKVEEVAHLEIKEGDAYYALQTYVAEGNDAMHLTEGERVYVLEWHNSDWWFVRKHLTEETGWVPSQYLKDDASYTMYVQKKLEEKIGKLPVFDKPSGKMIAPSIVTKIQPVRAPDGKEVTFEAKVEGNPRPLITWFRQTAIIKPSQEFQMLYDEDSVATLTIKEVFPEDAGMITCVAKNPAGFAACSAELVVDPPLSDHGSDSTIMSRRESSLVDVLEGIPPTFSQRPKTKVVDEGSSVELEVRLAAVPEPEISWMFNGKTLKDTKRITIATQSDVHMYCSILKFKEVKMSDEGCYEVLGKNREGEAVNRVFLKVTPKKQAPVVVQGLKSATVTEYGAPITLQAVITGIPAPKISWYHNGVEIHSDTKVTIIADSEVHTVVISGVSLQSEGDYMLHAENEAGQVQTSANVVLQDRPEPADFIQYFDDLEVTEGHPVNFTAKFVGHPAPEVVWYRNGKKIKGSKNVIVTIEEGMTSLDILESRIEKDAGEYNCAIHNNAGKAICGSLLTVLRPLSIFVRRLTNIEVDDKTEVVFTCEVRKAVRLQWYKDGKELKHTSRIDMFEDGYQHRLVILSAEMGDSGLYTATAEGEESESRLLVKEAPPTFIKKVQDLETKERESALLEVEISKPEAEVTWHKDGEVLTDSTGKYEFRADGRRKQIVIRSVSIHDEGEYTCSLGENECTAELAVIELPPEIIKKVEDTTIARSETAVFEIELTKGDALVRWFKDEKEIVFDQRIQLQIDGKKQRLTISSCTVEDCCEISCSVGDSKSSARLTVEAPSVEFTGRLPDVTTSTKGTEASFTVSVSKEDAEVTWYRNKTILKSSDRYTITVDGVKRTLTIKGAQPDDADKYICKLGKLKTTSTLIVEVLQIAPKVEVQSLNLVEKVKKGQDVTFNIPFTAEPHPKVQWFYKNQPIKKSRKHLPVLTENCATITIHAVEELDCGNYTCKLSNACGDVTVDVTLRLLEKPSVPGVPESLSITDSSIQIHWKASESDGGVPIINYVLEYCEKSSKKWVTFNKDTKIVETQSEVTSLTKDLEYSFRVYAVNDVGEGPKSKIATFKIVAPIKPEAPIVLEDLKDTVVGLKTKVTLSCVINGVPKPTLIWLKDGKELKSGGASYENHVAKIVIKETVETSAATYICRATNEAGKVETSCRLTVQDVPTVEVEKKQKSQKLQIEAQFKVIAKISGYPRPEISWTRDGITLKEDLNCVISSDDSSSAVIIQSVDRSYSGKYVCTATNVAGSAKEEIVLKVIDDRLRRSKSRSPTQEFIDKPSKPEGLVVKKVDETVVLEWKPPADDGGLDISKYSIEKLDLDKRQWMKVADVESSINSYSIQDLTEGSEYLFRVVACNPFGLSEATESETVVIKSTEDKPSAPRGPFEISGMTDYSLVIKWMQPESDGGFEILEYLVEKRETTKKAWQKVGSTDGNTTYIEITHLKKSVSYHFRVTAKNCRGYGAPYAPDDGIIIGKRITPPSQPTNLQVVDVTSRSVTLQWGPSASSGGAELTGYVVEKRVEGSDRWEKIVTLEPSVTLYIVQNLKERSEKLYFRVTAENPIGLSEPAETGEVALKTHATPPGPPTAPLEMRSTGPHSIIVEWGEPESDGGAVIEGYIVAARDTKKTMWMEVGTVDAGVTRLNIKDMQEGHQYFVRVFARNEVGMSEPLESDEPIRVIRPPGYSEGDLPEEFEQEAPSVSFSTETLSSWMKEAGMDADIKFYARSSLLQRDEYFFRLWIYSKQLFK